jgi:hypothetical protein
MPTNLEYTRQTKANITDTMDFWMHPEFLPQLNPALFRQVTIKVREVDAVTFEWQGEFMRRKMAGVNKRSLDKDAHTLLDETIDGPERGAYKAIYSFRAIPNGTEIKYAETLEMGPLGFLAKGSWRSATEKSLDEAVMRLDAKSSR